MDNSDAMHDIARNIKESSETPEQELTDIVVPPFAVGVRFLDFEIFYQTRGGSINLRTAESQVGFVQEEAIFRREDYRGDLDTVPEDLATLDPRTGYLIRDIGTIDPRVETWTTGSGHQMPWGGGNAIGRLHTLRKKDYDRFGNLDDAGPYFMRCSDKSERELGRGGHMKDIVRVGDHLITIALSGDNFFDFQLLRPDPTAPYVLLGVYRKPHEDNPKEPFTIGAYHMGQDVAPVSVALKSKPVNQS